MPRASPVPWWQSVLVAALLACFSLAVLVAQLLTAHVSRVRKTNRKRRSKLYADAGVSKADCPLVVGFFHPYCNAGGGGERVLFQALLHHLDEHPEHLLVVYTGDVGREQSLHVPPPPPWPEMGCVTGDDILERCSARFAIPLAKHPRRSQIRFVPLRSRIMVGDQYWRRLTLLGQSWGSVKMGLEALGECIPDVWCDTMGYAFTYPLVRAFSSNTRIAAYVHYPTISTDMIRRVETRAASHTNSASLAASSWRSSAKLLYYRLFAVSYSFALRRADVLVANGSWTAAHLDSLTSRPKGSTAVVYPPCDTGSLSDLPLEGRQAGALVSLAQFRPEKEHATQLRLLRLALDQKPDLPLHLVLMGSARGRPDEERIASLRALATELGLDEHVEFVVNAPYSEVVERLSRASIGLSTMRDEHFGINVVEFMAAGLVTLSHASAGPLLDIAVGTDAGPTGFHAHEAPAFATELVRIMSLPPDEILAIRKRARMRAVATFGTKAFTDRWENELWARLGIDTTRHDKKRQ